jgi:hypothetical protein
MPRRYDDDPSNLDRGFREHKEDRPDPEERDKKSWREIDQQRDRGSHRQERRGQIPVVLDSPRKINPDKNA